MKNENIKERRLFTVKVVNLLSGLFILGLSIWVLLESSAATDFLLVLIAISLVITGIARIVVGTSKDDLKKSAKVVKIASGLIVLTLGLAIPVIDIRWPTVSIAWLIFISSVALLVVGVSRFYRGIQAKRYPMWYRIIIIVAGIASIVISVLIGMTNLNVVMIIANETTQIILLACTLMLLALARISLIFLKKP